MSIKGKDITATTPSTLWHLLDMAQISNLCDATPFKIRRTLSLSTVKREDIYVLQRRLDDKGLLYNVIDYTLRPSGERRRVVSVRGTKNWKNIQSNMDSSLQPVEGLQQKIRAHRGYSIAAAAIFDDFHNRQCDQAPLLTTAPPPDKVYVCGHSMGGCVSVLLALALQEKGQSVGGVVTFGSPRFLDDAGVEACSSLPLACVEHCKDPITMPLPSAQIPQLPQLPQFPLPLPQLPNINIQLPKLPQAPAALEKHLHLIKPVQTLGPITLSKETYLVGDAAVREKNRLFRQLKLPEAPDLVFHKMDSYVLILATLSGQVQKYSLLNLSEEWENQNYRSTT